MARCVQPIAGMPLSSSYLGLSLSTPLVVSSSPLTASLDGVAELEREGAGAVVLPSLFEEQFVREEGGAIGEGRRFVRVDGFAWTPSDYLEYLGNLRERVELPIIASLNVSRRGAWGWWGQAVEEAGAQAMELNYYRVVTDFKTSAEEVEDDLVATVQEFTERSGLPLAVKLTSQYAAVPRLVARLEEAGARGVVLFNRVYQPDIELERDAYVAHMDLSEPYESRLRTFFIAMLRERVSLSLGATGGFHDARSVLKAIAAGADVVMLCSALLRHGISRLGEIRREMEEWLSAHGRADLRALRGSMALQRYAEARGTEHLEYARILSRYNAAQWQRSEEA